LLQISTNTLFIGKRYVYLPTCHSTNDLAFRFISEERPQEGMVICTSEQTKGRGQRGNEWVSAPDQNLTFSVILHPKFLRAVEQFRLNMAVSLAIADVLGYIVPDPKIKWPNDIFCKDKKLGGILIESYLKRDQMEYCVVGVGLNINQRTFPVEQATSLSAITGLEYDLRTILELLLEYLESRYLQLRQANYTGMKQDYLGKLYRYHERHPFRDLRDPKRPKDFEGEILGVDQTGRLSIMVGNEVQTFAFKEVQFMP